MQKTINLPETVEFFTNGTTWKFNPSALSAEYLTSILAHGLKQVVGDAAAGKAEADKLPACRKAFARLQSGEHAFGGGGGGAPLTLAERCLRDVLTDYLTARGLKKSEAVDAARDADATIAQIAKKLGKPQEKVAAHFAKQATDLAKVRAQAAQATIEIPD